MFGLQQSELIGGVLLYLSCTLASSGGIGGGGLNVPILLVVFNFSYKTAVILSMCTVMGNYIAQSFVNWNKRHPAIKSRPLIYWDVVLVLLPAQLGGGNIGVILVTVFPETILLGMSMLVVAWAFTKTVRKGLRLFNIETTLIQDADRHAKAHGTREFLIDRQHQHQHPHNQHNRHHRCLSHGNNNYNRKFSAGAADTEGGGSCTSEERGLIGSDSTTHNRMSSDSMSSAEGNYNNNRYHNSLKNSRWETLSGSTSGGGGISSSTSGGHSTLLGGGGGGGGGLHYSASSNVISSLPGGHMGASKYEKPISYFGSESSQQGGGGGALASGAGRKPGSPRAHSSVLGNVGAICNIGGSSPPRPSKDDYLLMSTGGGAASAGGGGGAIATGGGGSSRGRLVLAPDQVDALLDGGGPLLNHHQYVSAASSVVADTDDDSDDLYGIPLELPWLTLKVLALLWIVYGALLVTTQVVTKPCSTYFFVVLATAYIPLMCTIIWGTEHVARKQREDHSSVLEGDLNFNFTSYMPAFAAFVIGVMCALLGIGGGELMGPLLLHYKVLPQVSTATTSMMSLLNTASNIMHYAILGEIDYATGGAMFGIGLLGGCTGRITALYISKLFGRYSILIFMLCSVLVISFGLITYHIVRDDRDFAMHGLC